MNTLILVQVLRHVGRCLFHFWHKLICRFGATDSQAQKTTGEYVIPVRFLVGLRLIRDWLLIEETGERDGGFLHSCGEFLKEVSVNVDVLLWFGR